MKITKNVTSIRPLTTLTESQLTEIERAAVRKLSQALPVWHQQLGPGLDYVFTGLTQVVMAADRAASAAQARGASEYEIREAVAETMVSNLAVPQFEQADRQRASRIK